jgi:uncharacterized membrane protein YgdD (TMEM256/DUF423 family)
MKNKNLGIASLLGMLTIVLGAFGAHSLEGKIDPSSIKVFETAVRYQMFHVIVLLFVNIYTPFTEKLRNRISLLFFIGILFFSGSLYLISTLGINPKLIWFVTPLGGLLLTLGWLKLSLSFFKDK